MGGEPPLVGSGRADAKAAQGDGGQADEHENRHGVHGLCGMKTKAGRMWSSSMRGRSTARVPTASEVDRDGG